MKADNKRILKAAAAAVVIAALRACLPVYRVTGKSMEPELPDGSLILCRRLTKPKKGSIAAFRHNGRVLVKRIAALSGDIVECCDNGAVKVCGRQFGKPDVMACSPAVSCVVPKGRAFIVGDNREVSFDSRSSCVGLVSCRKYIGRAVLLLTPDGELRKL